MRRHTPSGRHLVGSRGKSFLWHISSCKDRGATRKPDTLRHTCRTWSCRQRWLRRLCTQQRQLCLPLRRQASQHRSAGCKRAT